MPRLPPHSMPRHCNQRFVFWCRRHAHPSRRCPWQAPREKTSTSRYRTTSLRWLHDHHDANLIELPRDLWRLLTVMEAGGVASSLGVQEAPRRRRACVVRGVSVSGRNLSQNALGVQLCLAATASHPRTPPPPARCRCTLGTQCIAFCRAYNLAGTRSISSPWPGASPAKTRVSSMPARAYGDPLRPATNSEQLREHGWRARACPPRLRYASASSSAFASCRSVVSKPSVNQP